MDKKYLKTLYIIFKKEFVSYFNSPIAYVFIAVFLIVGNWLFLSSFFLLGEASMRNYFSLLPWFLLFLTPAVTMRLWAEEKKSGTIEFLLTLPITEAQVVLGKFFGSLAFIAICLVFSLTLPLTLAFLGEPDWGVIAGSYLGALFLAGAYLSLGLFISGFTKNQIIAFIGSLFAGFLLFIAGFDFFIERMPDFFRPIAEFLGLGRHFYNISKGVIDSRDIFYYFSFIFLFLWMNAKIIKNRK